MPSGGDITFLTLAHPDLGITAFKPKAGVDSTYMPGGITVDDTDDGVDSSGEMIAIKTMQRASMAVDITWDKAYRGDLESVLAHQRSSKPSVATWGNIDGTVYKLTGFPVGSYSGNGKTSVITFKFAGDYRTFEKIQ